MKNIIQLKFNQNNNYVKDNKSCIINIEDVINYTWNNLKLDFNSILNEVYECLFILDDKNNINKQNIIYNISQQKELRNIIIDGLILNDLEYSKKFFDVNLQSVIEKNFHKFNPQYKLNMYQIKNRQIYKLYPSKYINLVISQISKNLKNWLKQMCQSYLNKQSNIIYLSNIR